MINLFHFAWLLGIALLAPVALPAGGAEKSPPQIRRRENFDPLLATSECFLRGAPCKTAPIITDLTVGTPLRILRFWNNSKGQSWMHVHVLSLDSKSGFSSCSQGWLDLDA